MDNEGYARYRKAVGPVEGGPFYHKLVEMTHNGSLDGLETSEWFPAVLDALEAERRQKARDLFIRFLGLLNEIKAEKEVGSQQEYT